MTELQGSPSNGDGSLEGMTSSRSHGNRLFDRPLEFKIIGSAFNRHENAPKSRLSRESPAAGQGGKTMSSGMFMSNSNCVGSLFCVSFA